MTALAPHPPPATRGGPGSASRLRRLAAPLAVAAVLLLASLALHLRDPHDPGSWGFCPWREATGTWCPGCGGLRAVHDLTRGDVAAAASSNLLLVGSLPAVAALWLHWLRRRWRGVTTPPPIALVVTAGSLAVVLVVAFWVARNLPAAGWLAP